MLMCLSGFTEGGEVRKVHSHYWWLMLIAPLSLLICGGLVCVGYSLCRLQSTKQSRHPRLPALHLDHRCEDEQMEIERRTQEELVLLCASAQFVADGVTLERHGDVEGSSWQLRDITDPPDGYRSGRAADPHQSPDARAGDSGSLTETEDLPLPHIPAVRRTASLSDSDSSTWPGRRSGAAFTIGGSDVPCPVEAAAAEAGEGATCLVSGFSTSRRLPSPVQWSSSASLVSL